MARRERLVTIQSDDPENRDRAKVFKLREMPADQAERWAVRATLALANAGARLPEGAMEAGLQGLAATLRANVVMGLRALAGLHYSDVDPLMREMMDCVSFLPGGPLQEQPIREGVNSQIEEVSTRFKLRTEVAELHLGFSLADALSTLGSTAQAPQSAVS